jgi:ATP-binding cassette subfamily B protein
MKKQKNTVKTASRVLKYLGRYKLLMLVSFLLAAASVAMTLYVPILIGKVVDAFGASFVLADILPYLLKITVLVLLTALAQWLMNTVNNRISFHIVRDVRNDAIKKIQKLPLSYLDSHKTGDIVSRMIADVDQFSDGLLMGFAQFFTGILTILGTLVFMLVIHPLIALLVVVLTPLSLFIARFIASRTHKLFS